MNDGDLPDDLHGLSEWFGVEPRYWSTKGELVEADPEALVAVCRARGVVLDGPHDLSPLRARVIEDLTRPVAPVVVVWGDGPLVFDVCLDERNTPAWLGLEAELEGGGNHRWDREVVSLPIVDRHELDGRSMSVRRVEVSANLAIGYHRLVVELGSHHHDLHLLVAPERVCQPAPNDRRWGVFVPLYSLRTELGVGPHVGDLDAIAAWVGREGGSIVATLPLLASYLDRPFDPSPYAPVSRRFWNELYLDLERLPETARSPRARSLLDHPDTQREIAELRAGPAFDYARQARLSRQVLAELAATFIREGGPASEEFRAFADTCPDVTDYARFRAAASRAGRGWHAWPEPARLGVLSPADYDDAEVELHRYAQFAMHRQMRDLAARLSARGQDLYLDLPVGAHPDGYDTWRERGLFAEGASTGAPPDDFFSGGQDWGFPPIQPDASRAQGHRHVAECLRHHMKVAGMVRLDHVMQLHRLYWVPEGLGATRGVYVRYPRQELFAVVAIESVRNSCLVVGEDLGTVPDEVREAMGRHGLMGMYVAQFQLPSATGAELPSPPPRALASVNTHDTPTFTGFLRALDIAGRFELGLLDEWDAARERTEREQAVANLVRFLAERGLLEEPGGEHEILRGLLRFLGESDAPAVLVMLDDLWGETDPHNVPGTPLDRPNWVQRMARSLASLAGDRSVLDDLAALERSRARSRARAGEMA
ncbi:4-alpha-glucanotransferase [Rhabdothermincola sp.]|uniref:4-alpha-glucanotransferase n=1 Tax=Rhabdothermincola sp. TaxID=2820405 RepID=UPI002FE15D84